MEQRERNLGCNPWWGEKDEEKKGEDWRMTLPLPAAGEVDNQLMISLQVCRHGGEKMTKKLRNKLRDSVVLVYFNFNI